MVDGGGQGRVDRLVLRAIKVDIVRLAQRVAPPWLCRCIVDKSFRNLIGVQKDDNAKQLLWFLRVNRTQSA